MKIAIIGPIPPHRGGIAHHNFNLTKSITSIEDDVLSISFSRLYPKILYPGESDKDLSQESSIDSEPIIDMLNPVSWFKTYLRIKQFNPDRIIFHWWTTYFAFFYLFISMLIKREKYVKINIVHNLFPHEQKKIDKFLTKLALNRFDKFVFHSRNEENKFVKVFPMKEHHFFPLPLFDDYLEKRIDKKEAKKLLKFSDNQMLILMFGIIRSYKGLDYLLSAMQELIKHTKNYKLLVAGEFWESYDEYKSKIDELGLNEFVIIHNKYIPDEVVPIYFSAADLFVAPYVSGTQSGALKIALSYNLPIIATSIISDEKKPEDKNWVVVPSNDSEALLDAILNICLVNESRYDDYATWVGLASFLLRI